MASGNVNPCLVRTPNRLLMHHIRDCLLELKNRLNVMAARFQNLPNTLGYVVEEKSQLLLLVIRKLNTGYCKTIEGVAIDIEATEFCGGARVCCI